MGGFLSLNDLKLSAEGCLGRPSRLDLCLRSLMGERRGGLLEGRERAERGEWGGLYSEGGVLRRVSRACLVTRLGIAFFQYSSVGWT